MHIILLGTHFIMCLLLQSIATHLTIWPLGDTCRIHRKILVDGGIFNRISGREPEDQPAARFQAFLDSVWWPPEIARVPSKVGQIRSGSPPWIF